MSGSAAIPRFLLPRRSAIWRTRLTTPSPSVQIRHASTTKKKPTPSSKPLVLEKPTKFVPPSHGSKLRKAPPRYPGPSLSAEESARMQTKKYPHMMPPEGTFMHWFITNKSIHMYIALSTLFSMAAFVFVTNFKRTSPFADMLPHWTQLFVHPIRFTRTFFEVMRLHQAHVTAETQERRKRKVEDVQKRSAYRKAHGLDNEAFGSWTAKSDEQLLGPAVALGEEGASAKEGDLVTDQVSEQLPRSTKPLKKWLGIW